MKKRGIFSFFRSLILSLFLVLVLVLVLSSSFLVWRCLENKTKSVLGTFSTLFFVLSWFLFLVCNPCSLSLLPHSQNHSLPYEFPKNTNNNNKHTSPISAFAFFLFAFCFFVCFLLSFCLLFALVFVARVVASRVCLYGGGWC